MGEIADLCIYGACCALCLSFFEKENNYPCVCEECFSELNKNEKKHYQLSTIPLLNQ